MTCIVCPVGCTLTIDDSLNVTGNRCKRGEPYAIKELTNPTRILTSTVRINSVITKRLSVKTAQPVAKEKLFDVMARLNACDVRPPVNIGDVIVKNIDGDGTNLIATRKITH